MPEKAKLKFSSYFKSSPSAPYRNSKQGLYIKLANRQLEKKTVLGLMLVNRLIKADNNCTCRFPNGRGSKVPQYVTELVSSWAIKR